jgi:glycine hydroxymethyltransferase
MKEADMVEVGRLLSRALHSVDNETALAEVKRDVHKVCGRFPLYASRLEAYDKVLARA